MMDCIAIALLALMIQTEAAHEPLAGKIAVAYVAMNRVARCTPQCTLQMVLTQPRQFQVNPRIRVSESSMDAAHVALYHLQPDPTHGADHFYNPDVKPWPPWYNERYMTVKIGHHAFLKLGGF